MQAIHKVFHELITSLRKWFNSTCSCDGYNNLLSPKLTCIDGHTGIVTSKVHRDGLSSAEELINLATVDIQSRNPPVVHLSHGWILCLSIHDNGTVDDTSSSSNSSGMSLGLWMLIVVCVASLCTILALLLCITTAITYVIHKRYVLLVAILYMYIST